MRSYADITTKLATRRELYRYYYEARDALRSYSDISYYEAHYTIYDMTHIPGNNVGSWDPCSKKIF